MLRKLNYTSRLTIPSAAVKLVVHRDKDGLLSFDAAFDFASMKRQPPEGRLILEAFYRSSYMRFDCGTSRAPSVPADRVLREIDSGSIVQFLVKIVDQSARHGQILAQSEVLAASDLEEDSASHINLLPVSFRDLGERMWAVAFEPSGPVLELNSRIESIEQLVRHDPRFFALVYPPVISEILGYILLVEEYAADEDPGEWWSLWLQWSADLAGEPAPIEPDRSARREWIEQVIRAFCERQMTASGFSAEEER